MGRLRKSDRVKKSNAPGRPRRKPQAGLNNDRIIRYGTKRNKERVLAPVATVGY